LNTVIKFKPTAVNIGNTVHYFQNSVQDYLAILLKLNAALMAQHQIQNLSEIRFAIIFASVLFL